MKILLIPSLLLATLSQLGAAIWPMPQLPTVPSGQSSATSPMPRLDWLERVQRDIERGKKEAASTKLVFDGDSITDGWQSRGKAIWQERYAKLGAFDFGIPGDRTQHVLWRLSQGQATGMRPTLIALMIGTNNLGKNTPEEIAKGVRAIVLEYQKRCPGTVILLQAIFPRGELPTDPNREKIKQINEMISRLGDGKKVIYVDFGDKFLQPDGTMSKDIMPDFLHPSEAGYQIWADAIQPIIDQYFPNAR